MVRTSRLDEAQRELDELWKVTRDPELEKTPASFSTNSATAILRIAPEVVAGELAARRGDYAGAVAYLEKAVRLEDALVYTEPADWPLPVRHVLGNVLLEAGRPLEAEMVYWEDLRQNPENGWSLVGLAQALRAQGRSAEAEMAEERFAKAWVNGDVKIASSSM
jgi:predicted Zn-dependent protease